LSDNCTARPIGHVLGNDKITIDDTLAVLKFLANIDDNPITQGGRGSCAWNASLITVRSKLDGKPTINDVTEILKHLAKIYPNDIDNPIQIGGN
jgi:hypothetical protein